MPTQQSHTLPSRKSQHTSQNLAKSVPAPPKDKFNFFLPSLRCFNFFATHSRHKNSWTETAKPFTDKDLTMPEDRRPAYNSRLASCGVTCLNSSAVLLLGFSGRLTVMFSEIPHERQAPKRYPKVAVRWLNQALCFYQSLCLVDNEVLRNRHLRVAAKRCASPYRNSPFKICINTILIEFTFIPRKIWQAQPNCQEGSLF